MTGLELQPALGGHHETSSILESSRSDKNLPQRYRDENSATFAQNGQATSNSQNAPSTTTPVHDAGTETHSENLKDKISAKDPQQAAPRRTPKGKKDRRFPDHKRRGVGHGKGSKLTPHDSEATVVAATPAMIGKRKKQNRVQIDPASTEHLNPKDSEETLRNIIENEGGEGLDHWIRRHPYEMAVRYPSGLTPLLIAAKESSPDSALASVEKILAAPNIDVNAKDKTGRTALHTASLRGLVDVAARLLKSKAQIDACDHESMTALHLAVMERCTSIVKLLIDNNANPNATTARRDQATTPMKSGQAPGLTPLHIAAFRGYKEIMKILLNAKHINVSPRDYGSGLTPLHEACRGCNSECASNDEKVHADVASLLIDYGADVNATTEEKFTPLHMASLVGRTSVVKVLMDAGADPSRYTSQMANAESLAPENVREQIAKILHHRHRGSISRPPPEARLEIAQPRPDQEGTCKDFKGFIWPALNGVRTFSPCAIWDMLYRPQPLLSNRHEKAIWIHLPSNNRIWVEDVFKSLYDSGRLLESRGADSDGKRSFQAILHFIRESFGETDQDQGTFQRPHFRVSKWSQKRPNTPEQRMTSIMLPLIDVDMQQPEYFTPEPMQQDWEQEIQETGQFTAPPIKPDDYSSLTPESVKQAEQEAEEWEAGVVRALTSWEGSPLSGKEEAHVEKAKTLKSVYSSTIDHPKTLDQSFHEHLELEELNRRNGDQVISRYLARAYFKHQKSLKDTESENDEDEEHGHPDILSPVVSKTDAQDTDFQQRLGSFNRLPMPRRPSQYMMPLQPDEGTKSKNEADMRQQVLMVQCLRVWKFENIVVTSYPERLALSNKRTLSELIRDTITRLHHTPVEGEPEYIRAQKVVEDIVEKASQFEPKFTVCARERTFNNAFAGEIAHVSSKVTRCYSQYQDILGRVESNFAKAVEKETSYLVMIDDILDEISMIKRVTESQDQVLLQIEQLKERRESSESPEEDTAWYGFKKPLREQCNDLERLEEDAKRVRKSVTTLLELRQRQASTENVVSLREQSEILFQQSKILFIFTGATVVFAPLSWINSMLALKIHDMTPKSEWWSRWQAFLSSFIGLIGTLMLCLAFWLWAEGKSNSFFKTPQMRAELERSSKRKHNVVRGFRKAEPESYTLSTRASWASTVGKTTIGGGKRR